MISQAMQDALNDQINREQYSAQLYLGLSAHCERMAFKGFAHWLRFQAAEETSHALKLIDLVLDRKGKPELQPVPAPPREAGGIVQIFEQILRHEMEITQHIHGLFALARSEGDFASELRLQWFVAEQVEEEAVAGQILEQLRAVGDKGGAVWYLDSRMAKRAASS